MNFVAQNGSAKTLKDINLRKQPAAVGVPKNVPVGEVISFTGWVTDGEVINSNGKWFKTKEEDFFWSGNVEVLSSPVVPKPTPMPATVSAFLSVPIQAMDGVGKPVTPFTARIAAILDHEMTSLDPACKIPYSWGLRAKNKKVKAFNGEIGDGISTSAPPYGYTKIVPGPFFSAREINYVGVYDQHDTYSSSWYLNYDGHCGYDFSYSIGTPIIAPADGDLSRALVNDPINGNNKAATAWDGFHSFYIDHRNGFFTWFLHCSNLHPDIETKLQVSNKVFVARGQIVAYLGKVGTMGAHLHFEVRDKNNCILDPYADKLWL